LRVVGKAKAIEMVLVAGISDAQEAHGIGLVNKAVSPEESLAVMVDDERQNNDFSFFAII
jgi:enoyl-CoA hydratase/carnithine racemase